MVGATRTKIETPEEAAALVKRAASSRAVEATAMNAVSSRSHSVFMLYICGHHPGSSTHLLGGLNLIDLAGRSTPILSSVNLHPFILYMAYPQKLAICIYGSI